MDNDCIDFRAAVDPESGASGVVGVLTRLRCWMVAAGVEETAAQESLIAVGEACANAVEHSGATPARGRPPVEVSARLGRRLLRLKVTDTGRWLHRCTDDPAYRNRGRGRTLMAGLMNQVQLTTGPAGTVVELTKNLPETGAAAARRALDNWRARQAPDCGPRCTGSAAAAPAGIEVDRDRNPLAESRVGSMSFGELHPAVRRQVPVEVRARRLNQADVRIESATRAVISERQADPGKSPIEVISGPQELLDAFSAAKLIGCSTRTLRKLVAEGRLHAQVGPRNRRRYTRSGIESYLAHRHRAQGRGSEYPSGEDADGLLVPRSYARQLHR
jgi:anti-sigma regulatory factor (Ser/Thr protein kinase)